MTNSLVIATILPNKFGVKTSEWRQRYGLGWRANETAPAYDSKGLFGTQGTGVARDGRWVPAHFSSTSWGDRSRMHFLQVPLAPSISEAGQLAGRGPDAVDRQAFAREQIEDG